MASPRMVTAPQSVVAPAIYARVSSYDQDCQLQLNALYEHCQRMGYPKPVAYIDNAISGAKKSRPQLDAFMKAALAGEHDWIGVWKLDRFGRSVLHLKEAIAQLDKANVRFVSITQGIDTDPAHMNSMGRMMINLLAMIAEFERDTLIERVNAGRMVKFAKGEPDSWNLVYGFKKGKPEIDEDEAGLMRQIFSWRDEGLSAYSLEEKVTEYAQAHGLKPPRGERWAVSTMLGWLRSRQYICEYERGGEIYELPRIIDQDLWERVNAKMAATRRKNEGNPETKFLWTGFLYSKHDRPMCGHRDPRGLEYFRCQGSMKRSAIDSGTCACEYIRASRLEPAWGKLWAFLQDPAMQRSQALAYAKEEDAKKPARGKDARQKLEAAKAELAKIKSLAKKGVLDEDEAARDSKRLRSEILGYEAEVRVMGKVIRIASKSAYEDACEERARMKEPCDIDLRREVLNSVRDFKMRMMLSGDAVVMTGSVPVACEPSAAGENCTDRLSSPYSSHEILSPFTLRVKLAA